MTTGVKITPGFLQAAFAMDHAGMGHRALCVVGLKVGGAAITQANVDALLTAWATAIKPLHDNEVTYSHITVLHNRAGTLEHWESSGTVTGTGASFIVLPPNVTYLIKKSTLLAGRRFRGRLYVPYVSNADVTQQGGITAGGATRLATAATALVTQLTGVPTGCTDIALLHSASPPSAAPDPTIGVTLIPSSFVATQRRRLNRA